MNDPQMGGIWWWRDPPWEAALIKSLRRLGFQNQPDVHVNGDLAPEELQAAAEQYMQCMYYSHHKARLTIGPEVGFIVSTAQRVRDARLSGGMGLTEELERWRCDAIDRAPAVFTAEVAHATELTSIQRFGASMLRRADTALRSSHAKGVLLTYQIPEIAIPLELLEIGQSSVRAALRVLWNNPIDDDAIDQAS
jgi:hypothetical protein